ncbi:hypothetical protein [Lichenibacterium dinghuense]|uniref:hypothetical protein n=1 Tax=Lichenibacterium dinghuense TaxID=2895977 RepID=UPI001F33BDB2|nr:hypothetical protein [Lichenibacterium sp. 6Y81]
MRPTALALAALVTLAGATPGRAEDAAVNADPDYAERYACVDRLSAANLGRGSTALASDIADRCLADFLLKHHSAYRLADVKRAAAEAPGGVLIDLMGKVPGVGDTGFGGMLTLRAEQNLDCRSIHPGEDEMVCNRPIDRAWIDENWPWWQKEFGGTRAEYESDQLRFMLQDQERRRRLLEIVAQHH